MGGILVKDLLPQEQFTPDSVEPTTTVFAAIELLAKVDSGALPVVESGRVVGILSERDYTRKVALVNKQSTSLKVSEIMSRRVISVRPDTTAEKCLDLMRNKRIRHLPVIDHLGELVGFVSVLDIIHALLQGERQTVTELKQYVSQTWPF